MSADFIFQDARNIKVRIPVYEGPLDLLLQLIERAELDITKVSLAQVTDQYLEHLKDIVERAAEQVSAFLIIAAKLLQIKSEVLLPRTSSNQEIDDELDEESLVDQLLTYKRFKNIALLLENRDALGLRTYLRLYPTKIENKPTHVEDVELEDLMTAAHSAFEQALLSSKQMPVQAVVPGPRISLRQKLDQIAGLLQRKNKATFRSMLNNVSSRMEIVVTFLALLELVKRHLVRVNQIGSFGEIEIEPAENWLSEIDFELEFETYE
ncbi:MAG: segregation/condensation protein A [Anaerolineales bacterium]|nr:segregation/condensation protein A [Anaerolineales bacterium]